MKRTVVFLLVFLFITVGAVHAERGLIINKQDLSHKSGKLGGYRALIIGINDYQDPAIPDLKTAVNDAKEIEKVLRERYGFKTDMLLERKATREAITNALRNLAETSTATDSVLIYYAGHGEIDKLLGDGWWVPADAKGGNPTTYLDNTMVQKVMRGMQARHVLLISDSCYSGTLFGEVRALPPIINDKYYLGMYNEKSRWGMTSGNKTPVSDQGTGGHSVFAYQLIKELSKNDKPYISVQELYTQIAPIVGNNSEQTPLCKPIRDTGDQGGNFVFVASLGAPPAIPRTSEEAPPASSGLGDIDAAISQWTGWQSKMEADYQKALSYDQNGSLDADLKKTVWGKFLSSYGTDNPYSGKDNEMRTHAGSRETYWASARPTPKPATEPARKETTPSDSSGPDSQVVNQDGYYVAYANGVVFDNNTGLEWYAGPDKSMSWNEAKAWVDGLSIGGGGWRMPTRMEWDTLYQKGKSIWNMTPLVKTKRLWAWAEERDSVYAWWFDFRNGEVNYFPRRSRNDIRAFAVRSRG